ncbi:hypothetical protein TNCV_2098441 [Trichonephila clavipes]|nr:hypothetical protein TNCV_2098441 [Trichonephila clavipes]
MYHVPAYASRFVIPVFVRMLHSFKEGCSGCNCIHNGLASYNSVLTFKGYKPVDIHHRMLAVYGDTHVSKPTVMRRARSIFVKVDVGLDICYGSVKCPKW